MKDSINRFSRFCYNRSFGMLLLRVVTGLIFFIHGWEKFQHIDQTVSFMNMLFGMGPFIGYFIATLETVGGAALILGILTRGFGILFGIEMLVAILKVSLSHGFHGYEFELLLSAASFAVAFAGSGKYSLFKMGCAHCGGMFCKGEKGICPAMKA